jgi:hypothetical protein
MDAKGLLVAKVELLTTYVVPEGSGMRAGVRFGVLRNRRRNEGTDRSEAWPFCAEKRNVRKSGHVPGLHRDHDRFSSRWITDKGGQ